MKNLIPGILLLLIFCGCATVKPTTGGTTVVEQPAAPSVNLSEQSTCLLGYFNPVQMTRKPYSTWYVKGFDGYMPKSEPINKLLDINKDNLTVKIVMGTWCPDSRREVPRFMKVLDTWHFPAEKVTFIGVDNAKLSPVEEYVKLDIQRVPTFIIYKNNIEAGRIIENPKTSLEKDMVNILSKNDY
ncbi:MAG: thioredoxin family protein [Bacteroidia bacterium]|nr:thioredoxin family protein [Bacteroidia bacterium]